MELRVGASAKQLIRRAMAVSGLTAGDLAYEGARKVLDEHERMVLTGSDREALLKAVCGLPLLEQKACGGAQASSSPLGLMQLWLSSSSRSEKGMSEGRSPVETRSSMGGFGTEPARMKGATLRGCL